MSCSTFGYFWHFQPWRPQCFPVWFPQKLQRRVKRIPSSCWQLIILTWFWLLWFNSMIYLYLQSWFRFNQVTTLFGYFFVGSHVQSFVAKQATVTFSLDCCTKLLDVTYSAKTKSAKLPRQRAPGINGILGHHLDCVHLAGHLMNFLKLCLWISKVFFFNREHLIILIISIHLQTLLASNLAAPHRVSFAMWMLVSETRSRDIRCISMYI